MPPFTPSLAYKSLAMTASPSFFTPFHWTHGFRFEQSTTWRGQGRGLTRPQWAAAWRWGRSIPDPWCTSRRSCWSWDTWRAKPKNQPRYLSLDLSKFLQYTNLTPAPPLYEQHLLDGREYCTWWRAFPCVLL